MRPVALADLLSLYMEKLEGAAVDRSEDAYRALSGLQALLGAFTADMAPAFRADMLGFFEATLLPQLSDLRCACMHALTGCTGRALAIAFRPIPHAANGCVAMQGFSALCCAGTSRALRW